MFGSVILTCEHAGNVIPTDYIDLFKDQDELLASHRAIDIGAYDLAKHLEDTLRLPLFYTTISRLFVEANRSKDAEDLFSEFTYELPGKEKDKIIKEFYDPYRSKVEEAIAENIKKHKSVLHLSIHTFTPVLNGSIRGTDIGLLFDPERSKEVEFCNKLSKSFERQKERLVVKDNYPYKGTADGFTTSLRKKFDNNFYAGIEIEINQKFVLSNDREEWSKIKKLIENTLKETLKSFLTSEKFDGVGKKIPNQ